MPPPSISRLLVALYAARRRALPVFPTALRVAALVRAAFIADCLRDALPRFRATLFAWRDKLLCEAAECPSRFSACVVARERFADGRCFFFAWPLL